MIQGYICENISYPGGALLAYDMHVCISMDYACAMSVYL